MHDFIIKPAWTIKRTVKDRLRSSPGYCSAVGFGRKYLPPSQAPLTRLKLSQGNVATAPARDFQGLCPYFRQMKDLGEVAFRNYLEVSFRSPAGVGAGNNSENKDIGLLSGNDIFLNYCRKSKNHLSPGFRHNSIVLGSVRAPDFVFVCSAVDKICGKGRNNSIAKIFLMGDLKKKIS